MSQVYTRPTSASDFFIQQLCIQMSKDNGVFTRIPTQNGEMKVIST
jgi:hypothetical protein